MTLKIGYKASAEQFGPRELVEYAVLAEQVGLDSVMISDHFQPWRHNGGHAPFSLSWLAAVDAGFDHLVFHAPAHDQHRFLTSFAEDILPRLALLGKA